jgi:sigma-B regulation protein RsbU (phosphoserine phosphatase)
MSVLSVLAVLLIQFQVSAARLRADTAAIAIAAVALAVSLAALAVFFLRKNRGDRTLLCFAIFGLLYSARILLGTPVFRAGFGLDPRSAQLATAAITFCIQIPGVLFAVALIDAFKNRLAQILLWLAVAEAVCGLATVVTGVGVRQLFTINNILVIAVFMPAYIWLFYKNASGYPLTVLKVCFFIFVVVVIIDNLGGIGLLPIATRFESFGFIVLLAGMGWAAAERAIGDQQKLSAIERELEVARTIQKSILPENVPQVPGLDIAVRYEPMTAVAGDFYDFVRLDDSRLGVLVADVSGHGVPAALIASMLKMAFASHTADADDPARLLTKLNAAMCGKFSAHFVTATYALIDTTRGTLTFSGAAHPPILRQRNGTTEELVENGLMLGAFPFAQYTNASAPLARGDSLLFYTDGLVEATNARQEEFGPERLKIALATRGAAEIIAQVFDGVSSWSGLRNGRAQEDDLTAVAIAVN